MSVSSLTFYTVTYYDRNVLNKFDNKVINVLPNKYIKKQADPHIKEKVCKTLHVLIYDRIILCSQTKGNRNLYKLWRFSESFESAIKVSNYEHGFGRK